jgi:halimadienyl-diphosphate synthase
MINQQSLTLIQDVLAAEIEQNLASLGAGDMCSVAYDTAWMARLSSHFPQRRFGQPLTWLRQYQHSDGSWGGQQLHYHDRTICTLSAIIALRIHGQDRRDDERIQQGVDFLWGVNGKLQFDAHDTVGFSVLAFALINEAADLGLDVPHELYQDAVRIEKKLNMLSQDPKLWRYTTMVFSLEAATNFFPEEPDVLEGNGSVGTSPAATAATLLKSRRTSNQALNYLEGLVQPDGGVPDAAPIDTFEIAWSLYQLRLAGAITPDHPQVRRMLDFLWKAWSPEKGLSFSSYFPVQDLDCTATGFSILQWGGYPVSPEVFAAYEEEDHFRCYPGELDSSLSAHIRMLGALEAVDGYPQSETWTRKVMAVLRRRHISGDFWFDKWHMSPYYPACVAIHTLPRIGDDLANPLLQWIVRTQQGDGGWGFYDRTTVEETAYCLQALLFWDRTVARVDPSQLGAAAAYLSEHLNDQDLAPLWIAKCVYVPRNIVRAMILSALYSYATH